MVASDQRRSICSPAHTQNAFANARRNTAACSSSTRRGPINAGGARWSCAETEPKSATSATASVGIDAFDLCVCA